MAFKRWYCEFLHDDKAGDGVSWAAREAGAPLRSVAKKSAGGGYPKDRSDIYAAFQCDG